MWFFRCVDGNCLGGLRDPFGCGDLFNFGMNVRELLVGQAVPEIMAPASTVGADAGGLW